MRKLFCMMLMMTLLAMPALAEDVCTVKDAATAGHVTTSCSYLRVQCPLEGEAPVVLTVRDEWGTLIYQRDYGMCEGHFRSRDVHLPLEGGGCTYTVTLSAGGEEYSFTVAREKPLLTDSAVYAGGLTLRDMAEGPEDEYAVVLDLAALDGQTAVAPMLAGGMQIGEVSFTLTDGELTVSAQLTVEGSIDKANVYIAADALTASTFGAKRFTGTKTRLDRPIDLENAPYAAVMVRLTVTYDPDGALPLRMTDEMEGAYEMLLNTWQLMQLTTANEAVG